MEHPANAPLAREPRISIVLRWQTRWRSIIIEVVYKWHTRGVILNIKSIIQCHPWPGSTYYAYSYMTLVPRLSFMSTHLCPKHTLTHSHEIKIIIPTMFQYSRPEKVHSPIKEFFNPTTINNIMLCCKPMIILVYIWHTFY